VFLEEPAKNPEDLRLEMPATESPQRARNPQQRNPENPPSLESLDVKIKNLISQVTKITKKNKITNQHIFFLLYIETMFTGLVESKFKRDFIPLVDKLPISKYEKDIIRDRYINMVVEAERSNARIYVLWYLLTNVVTVSGVLITGLLSIDKSAYVPDSSAEGLFWFIWSLSIALTLANKWLYSFNVHKKFILNSLVLDKLYTEGWAYVAGIGKYMKAPDHTSRHKLFCARIERIKTKSTEVMSEINGNDSKTRDNILNANTISASPNKTPREHHEYPRAHNMPHNMNRIVNIADTNNIRSFQYNEDEDVVISFQDSVPPDVVNNGNSDNVNADLGPTTSRTPPSGSP